MGEPARVRDPFSSGPTITPTLPSTPPRSKVPPAATIIEQFARAPWSQVGIPVQLSSEKGWHTAPRGEAGEFDVDNFKSLNAALATRVLEGRMTVVFADEVLQAIDGKEECRRILATTPCVRMPFDVLWIEAAQPPSIFGEESDFTRLAVCAVKQKGPSREFAESGIDQNDWAESVKVMTYVRRRNGDMIGPVSWSEFSVGHNGYIFKNQDAAPDKRIKSPHWAELPLGMLYVIQSPGPEYNGLDWLLGDCAVLGNALTIRTIGLMNCSNVRYVDGGTINEEVGKKRRQRERLPLIKYNILKLVVGTKLVPLQLAHRTGEGVALHMVRGHFRDYSKRGLFGKYHHSAVWVPPHARGNPEHGTSIHDYSVSTEKESAQ